MDYCYLNGSILPYLDCRLHISDLQIQRGYGVFDFIRFRNGELPWLEDYTERLFTSIRLSGLEVSLSRQDFLPIIQSLQQKNGPPEGAIKVLVTGGDSNNLESPTGKASVVILQVPWSCPPPEDFRKGVHLISDYFVRPNHEVKTLYYYNSLRLYKKMKSLHAVDVLYHQGHISECSRANLFFVKEGRIFTPGNHILKGITRKQLLKLFGEIAIEELSYDALYEVDEMFMTSTSRDVTPVVSVDGKKIGTGSPGNVTLEIQEAFRARGW